MDQPEMNPIKSEDSWHGYPLPSWQPTIIRSYGILGLRPLCCWAVTPWRPRLKRLDTFVAVPCLQKMPRPVPVWGGADSGSWYFARDLGREIHVMELFCYAEKKHLLKLTLIWQTRIQVTNSNPRKYLITRTRPLKQTLDGSCVHLCSKALMDVNNNEQVEFPPVLSYKLFQHLDDLRNSMRWKMLHLLTSTKKKLQVIHQKMVDFFLVRGVASKSSLRLIEHPDEWDKVRTLDMEAGERVECWVPPMKQI